MNTDTQKLKIKALTADDIKKGCITLYGENSEETKLCMIEEEFRQGIELISEFGASVTFYGSARIDETSEDYKMARNLAYRISKELKYAILSGGGGGIMEAANRGAHDAGGVSVGLTIKLPTEQKTNEYVTDEIPFYFFFARQVSMSYTTEVCIFCPGGFGTFDELFEMLTLQQTGKIGRIPIILFGKEFWNPVKELITKQLIEKYKMVDEIDLDLFTITDNEDEIIDIIRKSKIRDGQDSLT